MILIKYWGLDMGADDYITKPFQPLEASGKSQINLRPVLFSWEQGESAKKKYYR